MKGYINNFLSEFIFRIYLPFSYLLKKKKKKENEKYRIFLMIDLEQKIHLFDCMR